MNKSWKTTLCGVIGSIGAYLATCTDPTWLPVLGKLLAGLSLAGIGLFARDKDVTSEQQGVK